MYKIKIINYKPYEHEVFQKQLDSLGKNGYFCKDLMPISFFKQVNHPVYYQIDFLQPSQSKTERSIQREKFFHPYLENNCKHIFQKHGMHVFVNDKNDFPKKNSLSNAFQTSTKEIFKYFIYFGLSLFLTSFFALKMSSQININSFPTYGKFISFIGIFTLLMTLIYRSFCNFYNTALFLKNKFDNKNKKSIFSLRKIYHIFFILSLVSIVGGLIEDISNTQNISENVNPVIKLSDLNITDTHVIRHTQSFGFIPSKTYSYLESSQNNDILLNKRYEFSSPKKAKKYFNQFISKSKDFSLDRTQQKGNIIYGYTNNQLSTIIIINDSHIDFISTSFQLNESSIQKIILKASKKL